MKLLLFALIFQLTANMASSQCKNISENPFEKLSWIADRWVFKDGEDIIYENWVKSGDTLFSGESYTVRDGDTVFTEQLKIEKIGDDVSYTAIVGHNPGPVSFKLIELEDSKAVFENPEHDFPNRIIYELMNNSVLHARVEGKNKKGEDASIELYYTRAR
jgi:hypothetical protein